MLHFGDVGAGRPTCGDPDEHPASAKIAIAKRLRLRSTSVCHRVVVWRVVLGSYFITMTIVLRTIVPKTSHASTGIRHGRALARKRHRAFVHDGVALSLFRSTFRLVEVPAVNEGPSSFAVSQYESLEAAAPRATSDRVQAAPQRRYATMPDRRIAAYSEAVSPKSQPLDHGSSSQRTCSPHEPKRRLRM